METIIHTVHWFLSGGPRPFLDKGCCFNDRIEKVGAWLHMRAFFEGLQ